VPAAASAATPPAQTPTANCTVKTPTAKAYCPEVVFATTAKANTLDSGAPSRTAQAWTAIYPSTGMLWRLDLDGNPRMDLLEKETVSKDGLTVTSTLKPNLKYSDGTPIRALDAVVALDRWRNGGFSSSFASKIVSATAVDDRTIVWKLSTPYPDLPWVFASGFLQLHPAGPVRANPTEYFKAPVSGGPLKVVSYVPGADDIVLEANPNYWAKSQVGRLINRVIPDAAARQLALEAGTIQYVTQLPIAAYQTLKNPAVRVFAQPSNGMFLLITNTAKEGSPIAGAGSGKFNRQAISAAINREQISQVAYFGLMKPACSTMQSSGNPYFRCTLPNDGKQDLKLARELLAKAGNPNGFTFDLNPWQRPGDVEAANVIAENLKEVGIIARVTAQPDAVAIANAVAGNYQMQLNGNNQPTPLLYMQNLYAPGGFWNTNARVVDPVLTAALDRAGASTDAKTIKRELYVANRLAYDSSAFIPLGDRFNVQGTRLPAGVLQGIYQLEIYVGTIPSIATQPGVDKRVVLTR